MPLTFTYLKPCIFWRMTTAERDAEPNWPAYATICNTDVHRIQRLVQDEWVDVAEFNGTPADEDYLVWNDTEKVWEPKSPAEVLAILSGEAAADFAMNSNKITGLTAGAASGEAVEYDQLHPQAHTIASHSDTTATGAETETLTDGSDSDALHTHTYANLTDAKTIGIADDNLVEVDDADAADDDYAKFTANGVEGRSYAEVRSDINVADGADVTGDNAPKAHDYDVHSGGVPYAELEYDDATSDPLPVGDAAADGTETSAARKDHGHATGGTAGGDLGGTYPNPTVDDGADSTAIHDNVAGEIVAVAEKATPVANDEVVIEDSADSNNKKSLKIGNIDHDTLSAGTVASHDTSATGAELDTLTDGSDADALHDHATLVTGAEAVSAVATADDYLKNDASDTTTGDLTVANLITAGNVDGVDVSVHDPATTGVHGAGANTLLHSASTTSALTTVGALASGSLAAGFTDVPVAQGGTGASTLTDHGVVLGSGAGAVTVVAPAAEGSQTLGDSYLHSPTATSDAAYQQVMKTVSITIEDPEADDDVAVCFFFQAVTIREIEAVIVGTSCTIDPYHNTDRSAGGGATDVLSAATAITATTSYNIPGDGGTLNDVTIPADSWLVMEVTAADSCTQISVTFRYTID